MTTLLERHSPSLIESVSPETRDLLLSGLRKRSYTDGEMIDVQGARVDHLYVVLSGACRVCKIDKDGRERIIAVLGPGQTLGAMQLLLNKDRTVDVFASGETEIGTLSASQFFQLIDDRPDFGRALLVITLNRLNDTLDQLDETERLPLIVRTVKLLISFQQSANTPSVLEVNQTELAQMLGASRVAVGKALRELSDMGMIKLDYSRITILDADALTLWARERTGDIA